MVIVPFPPPKPASSPCLGGAGRSGPGWREPHGEGSAGSSGAAPRAEAPIVMDPRTFSAEEKTGESLQVSLGCLFSLSSSSRLQAGRGAPHLSRCVLLHPGPTKGERGRGLRAASSASPVRSPAEEGRWAKAAESLSHQGRGKKHPRPLFMCRCCHFQT